MSVELATTWLPLEPGLCLGPPGGDLEVLLSPGWQAAAQEQPGRARKLLQALLLVWQSQLAEAERQPAAKKAHTAQQAGPFQSAAARPQLTPAAVRALPYPALTQQAQQVLQRLRRALPQQQAQQRQERTAAAFRQAEARARRQRRRE